MLAIAAAAIDRAVLCDWAERVRQGRTPGNYAVVIGVLSANLGVPRLEAVVGGLFVFCSGWAGAPVRQGLTDHQAHKACCTACVP